jgi:hypothetical protein
MRNVDSIVIAPTVTCVLYRHGAGATSLDDYGAR